MARLGRIEQTHRLYTARLGAWNKSTFWSWLVWGAWNRHTSCALFVHGSSRGYRTNATFLYGLSEVHGPDALFVHGSSGVRGINTPFVYRFSVRLEQTHFLHTVFWRAWNVLFSYIACLKRLEQTHMYIYSHVYTHHHHFCLFVIEAAAVDATFFIVQFCNNHMIP